MVCIPLEFFKRKLKGERLLFLSDGRVDGPCSLYSRFNNERGLTVWINHRRRNDRPASVGRVCAEIEAARETKAAKKIFNERLSCCNCVGSIDLPMGRTIGFLGLSEGRSRAVPYTTQRVRADKTLHPPLGTIVGN
jgi:hypothetical protein